MTQAPYIPPRPAPRLQEPINTRPLSNQEQIIILRASRLNGFKFVPWKELPVKNEALSEGDKGQELRLSKAQLASFKCWAPAQEALPPPNMGVPLLERAELTMRSPYPSDLVQDAGSDCSVVASLCALVAREERGHPTILSNIIYPYDSAKAEPEISRTGVYYIRLNFNGCYRRVVIDDSLPISKTDRMLHIIDRKCPSLLWPALLEKAYLTVRGGYDFPGSNSCTDLWILTGWIPEQIILANEDVSFLDLWDNIQQAFSHGDVLVTVGTSEMSKTTEKALGLAAEHSYAVLDLKEEAGRRKILLKNPWCEVLSWKSNRLHFEPGDRQINLLDLDDETSSGTTPIEQSPGIFWMDLNNVLQEFHSIYLNWNPGLFAYRSETHFSWQLDPSRVTGTHFVRNPQFSVSAEKSGRSWVLLCRHFQDRPLDNLESEDKRSRNPDSLGFLSLYAFDRKGRRVRSGTGSVKQAPYIDSAQVLLPLEIPANKNYTIAVSEQKLAPGSHTFSLIVFSSIEVALMPAEERYFKSVELPSAWTSSNAGGRDELRSHLSNPQFKLSVSKKTSLALLLEVRQSAPEPDQPDIHVNFKLLHGHGKRITKLVTRDVIANSGDYAKGAAHQEVEELNAGSYTIICSTWDAGQEAKFLLRVDSMEPCELLLLPSENAGRFLVDNLARPAFGPLTSKMYAPINPNRHVKLTAIAKFHSLMGAQQQQPVHTPCSPIRLSIEMGHGPTRHVLGVSSDGEFDDSESGVRVGDVDLWPELRKHGDVWLVLDRLGPPVGGGSEIYKVDLLVDGIRGEDWNIGHWRSWD